jgi:hypothetical protein
MVPNPYYGDDYEPREKVGLRAELEKCPGLQALLDQCRTSEDVVVEAQREFYVKYVKALANEPPYNWRDSLFGRSEEEQLEVLRSDRLAFPALIPEVWFNLQDVDGWFERPSRVDFVMFAGGKRCVIEIDGPSHYATTTRAAATRSTSEGWEVHRFSNHEVMTTPQDRFRDLLDGLPGLVRF